MQRSSASEIYENIFLVLAETLSRVIDFGDPSTAVLFADGAGVIVF